MNIHRVIIVFLFLFSSCAIAQPYDYSLSFHCPAVQGQTNVLANYGNYIGGYGTERNSNSDIITTVFFQDSISNTEHYPSNIDQGGYTSSSTSYAQSTGIVSCIYTSSMGYDLIKVSYEITNGKGGTVTNQSNDSIMISLPAGF